MLNTNPEYADSLAIQRRRAISRHIRTSDAVANAMADLAFGPQKTSDWHSIGGIAGAVCADLARRTGRTPR